MAHNDSRVKVPALKVRQWISEWDHLTFDPKQNRTRPKEHFYIFSLPASTLRSLAGIYRRSVEEVSPRKQDLGIQRRHDPARSEEIRRYVEGGYPWSSLSDAKRRNPTNDKLKKPGWLPTAVVVNILSLGDKREGRVLSEENAIFIEDDENKTTATLRLPSSTAESDSVAPIESNRRSTSLICV